MARAAQLTDGELLLLAGVVYQAQRDAAKGKPCTHHRCRPDCHACGESACAFLKDELGQVIQGALRGAPERVQDQFLAWAQEVK